MNELTDLSLLGYLHDADCLGMRWDCLDKEGRALVFDLQVHPDTMFPDWEQAYDLSLQECSAVPV